jgi:hypothetical protein
MTRRGRGEISDRLDFGRQAVECLRLAQQTTDVDQKALLLSMAQTWNSLGAKVEAIESLAPETMLEVDPAMIGTDWARAARSLE